MASKVFNDFSNLYSEVIDGTITYEEFLDFTDPKNPNSIYKDTIKKIENAIGSKEFANIDSKTKARVLNYYKEVRTTGDADFLGIKENFGIDPATLVNHRLLLKSGLKPVLDLTDKSDPGDISGLPFSFVSDSQINNNKDAYFRFRSYNEAGIPSEFVARGVKVDTGDSRDNIYSYPFFNYGDVRINKNDDEPAVEGFFENGDQRDLNKGILNLYYKDLSPAIQNTAKTIGTLRDEYGKSIITSGRGWEKEDEKQFDQWAYENLRSGKTMKDLEDMRIKLIDKYGKDREGGGREVPPENMKSFMDSFNEVLNEEVTLNIQRIHINSLGDIMLSPQDLMPTEWLIIEDNEKDEKKT